ncbi:MAG: hypothetical protein GY839_06275 [candidate division Zixibacteria bacterium]|nr:hypothetical protein [candidate division Zixibacteria bacterium]
MNQDNQVSTGMRSRKEFVTKILQRRDFDELRNWANQIRNPLRIMNSLLFDSDPLTIQRALEGLGVAAAEVADSKLKNLRKLVRHFFWTMNDESGNIGWYAPEAIGEILRSVPKLIVEYGHMLPAFLIEEPFEKGTRIAIGRVAEIDKSCFNQAAIKKLIQTLDDPDPYIRGTSIVALKSLGAAEASGQIKELVDDAEQIELYDFVSGEIRNYSVGELADSF